jgi:ornithine--oxo-acid transaminase
MMERGLLAKPTHGDKIRLAPPLVINAAQIDESLDIIEESLNALKNAFEALKAPAFS